MSMLARRAINKFSREFRKFGERASVARHESYCDPRTLSAIELKGMLKAAPQIAGADLEAIRRTADRACQHVFNLYGSGWRECSSSPPTAVNPPNQRRSDELRALLPAGYRRIPWQTDLMTGFQWQVTDWSGDINLFPKDGVDMKAPWELARGHHLLSLALAYLQVKEPKYAAEFRNQTLDFMSANPPRFGINWACTMDVAIRCCNWLLSWDIFRIAGFEFDSEFSAAFKTSVYEHGQQIFRHLEWHPYHRGNHYLTDLTGLAFVARYLPSAPDSETWGDFAEAEMLEELAYQFNGDGSHFEGSTCYHRLSTELLLWCVIARHSPGRPISSHLPDRLLSLLKFAADLEKPDGTAIQVGDNDSGRLFKVHSECKSLDFRHLQETGAALFGWPGFEGTQKQLALSAMEQPIRKSKIKNRETRLSIHDDRSASISTLPHKKDHSIEFDQSVDLDSLCAVAYPDFGLYLIRSSEFFLSIRCLPGHRPGPTGHFHNDHFSLELQVNGRNLLRDPGTFIYSRSLSERNRYRSLQAHFPTCWFAGLGGEDMGQLWAFPSLLAGRCLSFDSRHFIGGTENSSAFLYVQIKPESLLITATSQQPFSSVFSPPEFSPGYELKEN